MKRAEDELFIETLCLSGDTVDVLWCLRIMPEHNSVLTAAFYSGCLSFNLFFISNLICVRIYYTVFCSNIRLVCILIYLCSDF